MASIKITQLICPSSKFKIKCPYGLNPTSVTIHNTANNASARNEVQYMISNNNKTSFHYAVDDLGAYQGIPDYRNAYHAGQKTGNRNSLSIEICYSRSGGSKFTKAEKNAAILAAAKLKQYGLGIDKLVTHKSWSGKDCPHRTIDLGWERFRNMVRENMNLPLAADKVTSPAPATSSGSYNGGSVVDYMNNKGMDSSYSNRAKLAKQYGIANYKGTAAQNAQLLKKLKEAATSKTTTVKPATTTKPASTAASTSTYKGNSLVEYLDSIGVNSSYYNRAALASQYGIKNYKGTSTQNLKLLNLMRSSKTTSTSTSSDKKITYKGSSIVDYLESIGQDSGYDNRAKLAAKYGISGYRGTASQNTKLLKKMRGF